VKTVRKNSDIGVPLFYYLFTIFPKGKGLVSNSLSLPTQLLAVRAKEASCIHATSGSVYPIGRDDRCGGFYP